MIIAILFSSSDMITKSHCNEYNVYTYYPITDNYSNKITVKQKIAIRHYRICKELSAVTQINIAKNKLK